MFRSSDSKHRVGEEKQMIMYLSEISEHQNWSVWWRSHRRLVLHFEQPLCIHKPAYVKYRITKMHVTGGIETIVAVEGLCTKYACFIYCLRGEKRE